MPATEKDLFARFAELGIAVQTHRHAPVFTVAQAKTLRGELPGAHTKNLFLKDKKGVVWLVVALEDRRIDLKELRHRIGAAPLSFAGSDLLRKVLGVEPGAVTPFALINDEARRTLVVLDADGAQLPSPGEQGDDGDPTRRPPRLHPLLRPRTADRPSLSWKEAQQGRRLGAANAKHTISLSSKTAKVHEVRSVASIEPCR